MGKAGLTGALERASCSQHPMGDMVGAGGGIRVAAMGMQRTVIGDVLWK